MKTICTCKTCGVKLPKNEMVAIYNAAAGLTKTSYLCSTCANNVDSYYDENPILNNKKTNNGFTYSIEFEVSCDCNKSLEELAALQKYGWKPTQDSTVKVEYKSVIYQNKNALTRVLKNVDKIVNIEQWHDADDYGTHLNMNCDGLDLHIIERFYQSLFTDFTQFMSRYPQQNKALFGRDFTYWAAPINADSDTYEHTNCYNLQHTTHLEFRLPRYQDYKQYLKVISFEQEILLQLKDFCKWVNENEDKTAKTKREKAKKFSNRMLNIYCKYVKLPKQYLTKGYREED